MDNKKNSNKNLAINNKKQPVDNFITDDTIYQLQSLYNAAPLGMGCVVDRKIISVNEAFCNMLGYEKNELIGQSARKAYPSDAEYKRVGEKKYNKISKSGKGSIETRLKRKDGKLIDVLVSSVMVNPDDPSAGSTFTVLDISRLKESEENLKYRLEFERLITEISTRFINPGPGDIHEIFYEALKKIGEFTQTDRVYIMLFDDDFATISINSMWAKEGDKFRDYQFKPFPADKILWWIKKLEKDKLFYLARNEDIPPDQEIFKHYVREANIKSALDIPIFHGNKLLGCLGFNSTSSRRSFSEDEIAILRIFSEIISNVLKRRKMESDLHDSQIISKNIIEKSPIAIHIYKINQEGELILTETNKAADKITGTDTSRLLGLPFEKAYPGVVGTELPAKYENAALHGESFMITDMVYKDDHISGAFNLIGFQLSPGEMAIMYYDISEIKQTELKLKQSEERYRNIFHNILDVYFELSPELIITEVSPSVSRLSAYTREELIGEPIDKISYDDELKTKFVQELLKTGNLNDVDIPLKGKDGKLTYCSVYVTIEKDEKGNPLKIIGSLRDINDRLEAKEEITKLSRAVEQSPSSVVITNTEGSIEYVNSKFTEVTGYRLDEVIGKNPSILKTGKQPDEFYDELWQTISSGKEWRGEFHNKRKNGTLFWEMASISPIRNSAGVISHYLGIKEDITELKRIQQTLEESELHYRNLYMEAPNGYQSLNEEGYIIEVNPEWTQITGFDQSEVIGRSFADLLTESDRFRFVENFKRMLRNGEACNTEYDIINKNKEIIHITLNGRVNLDIDGNFKQTHCIITDFSERKKFEKELQIAKERAEESDRLKSAFLANMSHEIRTPMNAILGFSELLIKNELSERDKEEYIKMIHSKGKELMVIISDLIDISRIEAGDLKLTETNFTVNEFLSNIYDQFKEDKLLRSKSQVQFRKNLPNQTNPVIYSDKNRLKQVFNNLLSNAIKFTSDGFIELGYDLYDNQVRFFVKDSGIGIDNSKFDLIFERFRQADITYTRKYGGTGLGLAISKQMVELLGGNIWVESTPDIGSTFYFTLKFSKLSSEKENKTPGSNETSDLSLDLGNKKILVAEDDGSNYLYLESVLRNTNVELVWAKNGQQALDLFNASGTIDLILMDIRMPHMNGLEAAEQIRKNNTEIPIIALTAFAFADDKNRSSEAGCNEHLSKPVKAIELISTLRKYLN